MKKIILGLTLLNSVSAFANCTAEIELHSNIDRGASSEYFFPAMIHKDAQEATIDSIANILREKGYELVNSNGSYRLYLSYNIKKSTRFDLALGERVSFSTVNRIMSFRGEDESEILQKSKTVNFLSERKDAGTANRINSLKWLEKQAKKIPDCI